MKSYTFELVVREGSDEFWESIAEKSGCDEVTEAVRIALAQHGIFVGENENGDLKLKEFKDE